MAHVAGSVAPVAACALAVALILVWARTGRVRGTAPAPARAALGLLAVTGFVLASSDALEDAQCQRTVWHASHWIIRPDASMAPHGGGTGTIIAPCLARVAVQVLKGRVRGGALVEVVGAGERAQRGARIVQARVREMRPPSWLARWRSATGARIDAAFGHDAPLVRALVLADAQGLDPALRDRFAAAGVVHMLSVSGLHVAIIALAAQLLLGAARLPARSAMVGAVIATAVYVAAIGAPAAALRSGVMLAVVAASRLTQRPISPWSALAIGALAPLADARVMLDIGYELSVAGMAALIASGRLARRLPRAWTGWKRGLARELLASSVATAVTAPLVAWSFGQVSLIAPVTNLLASPVIGVLQPLLFVAMLAPSALARLLALSAHPLIVGFEGIATLGARVPFASLSVSPSPTVAICAGIAAMAAIIACVARIPWRAVLITAASLSIMVALPSVAWVAPSGDVELHVLDVGQGDAILLRTARGNWIVFDAGRAWLGGDAGKSIVVPYLRRKGGKVLAFVLSHPHADHVGGAATLFKTMHPGEYWDAAFAGGSGPYLESLRAARASGARWRRVHPGDALDADGVRVRFLGPDSAFTVHLADPNSASTIALVEVGAVRFLLVGDAEAPEEEWLLAHESDSLHADVLKVGHHGSNTSTTLPFLDAVHPRLAVVSVGAHNMYGHPSPSVIRELAEAGVRTLRTDRVGTIVIRSDGRHFTVEANGGTWTDSTSAIVSDSLTDFSGDSRPR